MRRTAKAQTIAPTASASELLLLALVTLTGAVIGAMAFVS